MGWHSNASGNPTKETPESNPVETKLELEGAASNRLPAELESPLETRQLHRSDMDEPPPYSPGNSAPVGMNREARISYESSRSIQQDIGRASEDSGFEKREQIPIHEDSGFDNRK